MARESSGKYCRTTMSRRSSFSSQICRNGIIANLFSRMMVKSWFSSAGLSTGRRQETEMFLTPRSSGSCSFPSWLTGTFRSRKSRSDTPKTQHKACHASATLSQPPIRRTFVPVFKNVPKRWEIQTYLHRRLAFRQPRCAVISSMAGSHSAPPSWRLQRQQVFLWDG